MLRQKLTAMLLVGVVLTFMLSTSPAQANLTARVEQRGVEPRKTPASAVLGLTTLDLDLSAVVVKSENGSRYIGFPLCQQSGWMLSKVGPSGLGRAENAIGKPSVGAADEEQRENAPESGKKERETAQPEGVLAPELEPAHAAQYQPEYAPIALISADDVNVRERPDLKSEVLATLPRSTKVYIISISGPWYYVSVPIRQLKGYVFGSFVYQLKEVVLTGDKVNLRESPSLDSELVAVLKKGERFVMLGESKDFFRVISPTKGFEGWVSKQYSKVGAPELPEYRVVANAVNFRQTPNVDAEIIAQLNAGMEVKALGRDEKWSLVEYSGARGWIYSEYLVASENFNTAAGREIGRRLAARGLDLRGIRYRWGGSSPSGFDCSGFVYFLLREQLGLMNLPRRASEQYYQMGTPVDKEDLSVGDLVFFTTYKAGPSHVGVYIGDGSFVHASSAGGKVRVNSLSDGYYKKRFVGARRITEQDLEKYRSG